MNKKMLTTLLALTLACHLVGQQDSSKVTGNNIIHNTKLSGEYFIGFNYNDVTELSKFNLKRGYFTLRTRLNDMLSVRYTQDITLDREGSDAGNLEIRLKYLYLAIDLEKVGLMKNSNVELGLIHRPWVYFEQKINGYRVQGAMFVDRYNISMSADFGIMVDGLIGGILPGEKRAYLRSGNHGRYGSYAIGVFNGGGYHSVEKNSNKVIESRLTFRPLPDIAPGIQLSWALALGKANMPGNRSDYHMNLIFVSAETRLVRFTAQYYSGTGSYDGELSDASGISYKNDGYSLFTEIPILETPLSLFSRYDSFNSHQITLMESRSLIGGIAYRFIGNKVIFNYQRDSLNGIATNIYEIALEISF